MFNEGSFATDPRAINRSGFFSQTPVFPCLREMCAGPPASARSSASLPVPFSCSSTPGKVTRGKPSGILQFLDCEIQQKHNQKHIGLLRAMAVSDIAYTKKSWLALKRKAQSWWEETFNSFHICSGQIIWAHMCLPSLPVTMPWNNPSSQGAEHSLVLRWSETWSGT